MSGQECAKVALQGIVEHKAFLGPVSEGAPHGHHAGVAETVQHSRLVLQLLDGSHLPG